MSALPKRLTDKLAGKAGREQADVRAHLHAVPEPAAGSREDAAAPATTEPGPEVQPTPPGLLERARSEFTPPDIWSEDRPALSKVVNYGRYGQQVPDEGAARAAATAWSWFAALNAAVSYAWQWVTERPSRTTIAVALVVLASLVPAARTALTVLLWPAHTAIELITDH
ncbi:hypothetical protein FFT09_22760 [Saccharomonospora piscinae]|nr:hypothetical protein FFT09_22760 [Saccharomonospora piscinae]